MTKRIKRVDLEALLDEALEDLHHNATLSGKLRTTSEYEDDLLSSYMEGEVESAFDDLRAEFPWLRKRFGEFYQYGRGGRTVMPCHLARSHRYSHAVKAKELGLEALEARRLLKELLRFNAYVRDWCKSAPDHCLEYLREEYADEIKANEGKKRKISTVVRYE